METVRHWATIACAAAIAGGLVLLVLPQNSRFYKLMQMVVSLFFLCSITSPLASLISVATIDLPPQEEDKVQEYTQRIERSTESFAYSLAKENINKLICKTLESLQITPKSVVIYMEESKESILSIRAEITVAAALEEKKQELEHIVKEELGITAVFQFS